MSQDTGAPKTTETQEIDLDEIEVEILILAKNPHPLQHAASFLTRRGWPTTVIGNLQKAVEHVAEKRPDFVLVSVNHPHPTITKLPDIITQAFKLTCVAFAESADTGSNAKLNGFKSKYKITGGPSGPNVHRSLRKILAEKFNINLDEKGVQSSGPRAASENGEDDTTVFSGSDNDSQNQVIRMSGGKAGEGRTMVQKSAPGATSDSGAVHSSGERSKMMQNRQAGGGPGEAHQAGVDGESSESFFETQEGSGTEASEGYTPQQQKARAKNKRSLRDINAAGAEGSSSDEISHEELSDDEADSGRTTLAEREAAKKAAAAAKRAAATAEVAAAAEQKAAAAAQRAAVTAAKKTARSASESAADSEVEADAGADFDLDLNLDLNAEADAEGGAAQGAAGQGKSKDPGHLPGSVVSSGKYTMQTPRTRKSLKAINNELSGKPADAAPTPEELSAEAAELLGMVNESLFGDAPKGDEGLERAQVTLKHALQKAFAQVTGDDGTKTEQASVKLEKSTRIGVFPIDSLHSPGYLTVALDIDAGGATEIFLKSCESVLRESFQRQGFDGKLEDGFWLSIPEVDFEAWANEMSLFHFKFNHADTEVVAAFFQTDQPLPKLRGTSQPDMVAVGLENITVDQPVNFKAYLYLEKNHKFFLYLRNGRSLAEKQKEHLLANDVKDICLKSGDAQNLRMFMASIYLKDMIKLLAA